MRPRNAPYPPSYVLDLDRLDRQDKHVLFGQQEGRCNGCRSAFPYRVLEVDHIIPRGGGQETSRTCSCYLPTAIG